MLKYEMIKETFDEYLKDYDANDDKVKLKIEHTYGVAQKSEYLAKNLMLGDEDINIAVLIGYLHDIGRFEQLKKYDEFDVDGDFNHAEYGVKILFEDGLIRKFIDIDDYDEIIKKAILNHNKYKIDKQDMNEKELLHSEIIRDADKLDNFRVKEVEEMETLLSATMEVVENDTITEEVYTEMMDEQVIQNSMRKTYLDKWISYLAYIYDFNFAQSLKYIKDQDYIARLINRINYKDANTKIRMQNISKCLNEYIDKRIG